ncbi:FixH family protein [Halomonas ramblicola]|uniref:FixH family protein n=1 Tax=Halomonas ramblicola TaxID=747349 RepID=UPI0025B3E9DA|nr:FixH family protein [Halomonas ramblicola]MDN3523463.1 FixH family protein [Halomonas ramblicola]
MSHPVTPWYKQFWPWFLIGLLLSSVAFSLTYLAFSIRYFDGSVGGDYYERGLAINEQLAKQEHAQELGLSASLRVDARTGDVVVDLAGERQPKQLHLALIFPTDSDFDRELVLDQVRGGRYVTTIDEPLRHRWYLQLQPEAGEAAEWRLTGEARFPSDDETALVPGL